MKKLIGIGIAAMMVMGLAGAASAFTVKGGATVHTGNTFLLSSASGNAPTAYNNPVGDQNYFVLPGAVGNNTGAAGTFYTNMYVKPVAPLTLAKTFTFAAFVDNAVTDSSFTISMYGVSNQIADIIGQTWKLRAGVGTEGAILASGKWTSTMTSSAAPVFTYTFADTANMVGAANAYLVTLDTNQVVPEPGSMVAMFSGLVGLVGFGIRRKK